MRTGNPKHGKASNSMKPWLIRLLLSPLAVLLWLRWGMRFEGMSLRPFGADGVVSCDGGEGQNREM